MNQVLVNRADWTGAPDIPDGWLVVNAPRPLLGEKTWTGDFRHGIFYAAGPDLTSVTDAWERKLAVSRIDGWKKDDAWPVVFITNEEIAQQAAAKVAEHGWESFEDAGVTVEEIAAMMQLPWHAAGAGQ